MKHYHPRILIIAAGLILLTLFLYPLWRISLYAPQYPKGVHMHIHIDKIGGSEPGTLPNINFMNHYIGMKPIEPDSIPELRILPKIVLGFAIASFLCALGDFKFLYFLWVGLLILFCLAGLYDFYLWEYDYGHNLAPDAPMTFEDVSFQPPLIGKKKIINFTAVSVPHIGGYIILLSLVLGTLAAWIKSKFK